MSAPAVEFLRSIVTDKSMEVRVHRGEWHGPRGYRGPDKVDVRLWRNSKATWSGLTLAVEQVPELIEALQDALRAGNEG